MPPSGIYDVVYHPMICGIFSFNAFTDSHTSQSVLCIKSCKISYIFEVYLSHESTSEIFFSFELFLLFLPDFPQLF